MVGARGFEPPTSCSQSRRAARLRHAPFIIRKGYNMLFKSIQAYKDNNKLKLVSEKTDLSKKGRHLFLYMIPKTETF